MNCILLSLLPYDDGTSKWKQIIVSFVGQATRTMCERGIHVFFDVQCWCDGLGKCASSSGLEIEKYGQGVHERKCHMTGHTQLAYTNVYVLVCSNFLSAGFCAPRNVLRGSVIQNIALTDGGVYRFQLHSYGTTLRQDLHSTLPALDMDAEDKLEP